MYRFNMKLKNENHKREYIITIPYSVETRTIKEGEEKIREIFNVIGFKEVKIDVQKNNISHQQRKALHLYFNLLAEALNEAGFDMKKVLKQEVDIPWNKDTVKEYLWRPIQKAYLGIESSNNLEQDQIDKVWEILNRMIGEKTGVHVPFPCEDNQLN